MTDSKQCFSERVLSWFDQYGRHDLPWQKNRNSYRVWVAEIMLQQTQVKTAIPYYQDFLKSFPSIALLASATLDEVLNHWAGLGYYSRARNLHKAAIEIMEAHQGTFPTHYDDVLALPGIGPSTAGAILAQALNQRHAILDGNVKRVLSRYHAIEGWSGQSGISKLLWDKSNLHTPHERVADYTQAIMDLGATLCVRSAPKCPQCPVKNECVAFKEDTVSLYPTRKAKKTLPVKQVRMLIIKNQHGSVLLEKRPPTGIWGGLWSLPEAPLEEGIAEVCLQRWALKCEQHRHGDVMRHTFSHYHLDISPCWLKSSGEVTGVKEREVVWCQADQMSKFGVATPISLLLHQSFE